MATDVIMPALGMAQETGRVIRWLKAEGDAIAKGEPLMEVETDKVTVEVEAPVDGKLTAIRAAEGDDVAVGSTVALILADGEQAPVAPPPRRSLASPRARRMAAELGVDLAAVRGSGPNGEITAEDVVSQRADPGARRPGAARSAIWRVTAERTARSWREVPHFYLAREVDASGLEQARASVRRSGGEGVTHSDLLIRIAAIALRAHPRVNSAFLDGRIVANETVDVGLAVAVDDGLLVPVIHRADRLGVLDIASRRQTLVSSAREGTLRLEDVQGGTFTISNLGMFGVDSFGAIVNAPQAAILAVGRIAERVVPVDGSPELRPTMTLTTSFDHRVVDGAAGARFLETLASLVESPRGLSP